MTSDTEQRAMQIYFIRQSIVRQLGDDPDADRIILTGTDWDIVLNALSTAALAFASSLSVGVDGEAVVRAVEIAMQEAWDEICDDTSCHPLDITKRGRKTFFQANHWARLTGERVREFITALPSSSPVASQGVGEQLLTTAKLLYANAVGCAQNHYGEDFYLHGMPGWLADCLKDIEAAAALSPSSPSGEEG